MGMIDDRTYTDKINTMITSVTQCCCNVHIM